MKDEYQHDTRRMYRDLKAVTGWLCFAMVFVIVYLGLFVLTRADFNPEHSWQLESAVEDLRGENQAYYAVFCGRQKVFETGENARETWNFDRVTCAIEMLTIGPKTVVFNRPEYPDASFSLDDLANLHGDRVIVVTKNYNFILETPDGHWPTYDDVRDFWNELLGSYDGNITAANKEFGCYVIRYELDGQPVLQDFYYTSAMTEKFAERFGLIYTVEEINATEI